MSFRKTKQKRQLLQPSRGSRSSDVTKVDRIWPKLTVFFRTRPKLQRLYQIIWKGLKSILEKNRTKTLVSGSSRKSPKVFGESRFDHFDRELSKIRIHRVGAKIFLLNTTGQKSSNDISHITFESVMSKYCWSFQSVIVEVLLIFAIS